MNIVVCVKQVLDARLPLEITPHGEVVQRESGAIFVADPAGRCALEEAMRIRDEVGNCAVTAITLGPKRAESVLVDCLARGADQVIHLQWDDSAQVDSFVAARLMSAEIKQLGFDLILCGDTTLDDGPSELGPILAEALGIAQVTGVVSLTVSAHGGKITAERKLERGYRQVVETEMPALIAVDGSICQPRYITSRSRRYAAKTMGNHCRVVSVQALDLTGDDPPLRQLVRFAPPRPRPKKIARPDSSLSAEERLALIMGGAAPAKTGGTVTGGPEKAADEIIAFLREQGVLP